METLESQSDQEPQTVRDLLQGIRDGKNPMAHNLKKIEGGEACLKWIGLMHLNARTMLNGESLGAGSDPLPSRGPGHQMAVLGDTENIIYGAFHNGTGEKHLRDIKKKGQ